MVKSVSYHMDRWVLSSLLNHWILSLLHIKKRGRFCWLLISPYCYGIKWISSHEFMDFWLVYNNLVLLHYPFVQFYLMESSSRAKQMNFLTKLGGDDLYDKRSFLQNFIKIFNLEVSEIIVLNFNGCRWTYVCNFYYANFWFEFLIEILLRWSTN